MTTQYVDEEILQKLLSPEGYQGFHIYKSLDGLYLPEYMPEGEKTLWQQYFRVTRHKGKMPITYKTPKGAYWYIMHNRL